MTTFLPPARNDRERPDAAPWQSEERSENPARAYLDIFRRRRWSLLAPLVTTVLIVTWGVMREKSVYEATTTLLIEETGPQIISSHEALFQNLSRLTEVEILKDRVLVEKVVDLLLPQKHIALEDYSASSFLGTGVHVVGDFLQTTAHTLLPANNGSTTESPDPDALYRYAVITALQGALKVVPREGTKLIDITLSGYDRQAIPQHLNTVIDVYVKNSVDNKLHETRKILSWLQAEASDLKQKMMVVALSLKDLRNTKGLLELNQNDPKFFMQSFNDLNSAYLSLKRERMSLAQSLNTLTNGSASDIINSPILSHYDTTKSLKDTYRELHSQFTNLASIYKAEHFKLVTLRAQLEDIKSSILKSLRNEQQSLVEKEARLAKELTLQKNSIMKYAGDAEEYGEVRSEFDINQTMYLDLVKKIKEFSLIEASGASNVRVLRQASVPLHPVPTGKLFKILTSLVIGGGIGVGFALLKEYVDPNFKKGEEIETYLHIPFLGIIPRHDEPQHEADEGGAVFEAYQTLRTRIQHSTPTPVKTLLVTSAVPAEGKTTTVVNLGKSFAQLGLRVLLVDVDLRHPSLHRYFHLTKEGGLTDILGGSSVWGQVVDNTPLTNLQVLCAGTTDDHAARLLHTKRMQDLIPHLREAFDIVIFDAPIVLGIPDVEILASRMDGVLLVHHPARANKEVTLEATKILGRVRAPLLGMIFNNVNMRRQDYYRPHSPVLQLPA